jgi:dihydroflavonol-4-reductase
LVRADRRAMTALVTGATGFVGSAVARALLARGEPVRALIRPNSNRRHLRDLPVEIVVGDLEQPPTLRQAVAGCRAVYHVAADYRLWAPRPSVMYRINVDGTRALLRAAADAGVERIVYTSSVATLGIDPGGDPSDETTPSTVADMIGHYKRSKYLAEQAVRELIEREGLPGVIVNPSAPIGPGDARPTPTGRIVLDAAKGRIPAYVDTGLNVVHVDDVAAGHLLAYERGRIGERYILGGQNLSLGEILALIAGLTGRRPPRLCLSADLVLPIAYVSEMVARLRRTGEPLVTVDGVRMAKKRMHFSSTKAARELGYRSRPAADALRDALDWYRQHGYLADIPRISRSPSARAQ